MCYKEIASRVQSLLTIQDVIINTNWGWKTYMIIQGKFRNIFQFDDALGFTQTLKFMKDMFTTSNWVS